MLKIKKLLNQFVATVESGSEGILDIGPLSEDALKKELFALGYSQQDIQQAFYQSAPEYFGVGKW